MTFQEIHEEIERIEAPLRLALNAMSPRFGGGVRNLIQDAEDKLIALRERELARRPRVHPAESDFQGILPPGGKKEPKVEIYLRSRDILSTEILQRRPCAGQRCEQG